MPAAALNRFLRMEIKNSKSDIPDGRSYLRLKSVFPVEFTIVRLQQDILGIDWRQGYTCNVSKGGLCLETVHVNDSILRHITRSKLLLDLRIRIPITKPPIHAVAEVVWFKKIEEYEPARYLIGLKFHSIIPADVNRILAHAKWFQISSRGAAVISAALLGALLLSGVYNYKLRMANERLISQFVAVQEEEGRIGEILDGILQEKKNVSQQLRAFAEDIAAQEKEVQSQSEERLSLLETHVMELRKRKIPLENHYEELLRREARMADQLAVLERKKEGMQKEVLEKMHLWLKNHQSASTGLALSFEGNVEIIKDWAFIYDQALAANVFLFSEDINAARQVLNFFQRNLKQPFEGFPNAYYYDSGAVAEYTVHCGPNIWVGLAIMQYLHQTQDTTYLPMAKAIGDWLIAIQDRDPAGGLKGGPQFSWFATEHNLDAYAFFDMLFQKTQEEKYRLAREKILSWLRAYAMVPHGKDYKSPPINRGRGDATIATDTFAWSLAAIGPEELNRIGMDPRQIMDFAEEHCAVDVLYRRPSAAAVKVKGFDFAKYAHMPRGGMVSPEWTSQMIVSYQMLSGYFARQQEPVKAGYYGQKAKFYLRELNKLMISSPSARGQGEGCLPYATLEDADTGHGWSTPHGTTTCSIAGTAYTIMAIKQINPLKLK